MAELNKEVFSEYRLDYFITTDMERLSSNKLTYLLKYVRINNITRFVLCGFKNGEWRIIISKI